MKKILSLIFCCVFITLTIPGNIVSAADDNAQNTAASAEYEIISQLGLLPNEVSEKINSEKYVTRAEFAAVLYNILNFKNVSVDDDAFVKEFLGEFYIDDDDDEASDGENSDVYARFDDVTANTRFCEEIDYVTNAGYFHLDGARFRPESSIAYVDCLEALLRLLGADAYINTMGGYPDGVMKYGATRKIYTKNKQDRMTAADLSKLLYTVLDEEVVELTSDVKGYRQSDTLFMEKILGISVYSGILTNDGLTSLIKEDTQRNVITVGSEEFNCNFDCDKLLGMNVLAYVSIMEETEDRVLAIEQGKKNEVTEIDAKNFVEFKSNRLYYEENNKTKSVKIPDNVILVYNGKVQDSWLDDIFDFANGSIRIIDNTSDYNVVIIESYESIVVAGFDPRYNTIYNKACDNVVNNGDENFELNDAIEADRIIVKDSEGNSKNVNYIAEDMIIDILLNGDYAKLILNNEKKKNVIITSFNKSNDENKYYFTFSDGEGSYNILSSIFEAEDASNIVLGNSYTLYFNRNGDVSWIENEHKSTHNVAYLMRAYTDDDNENVYIKILSDSGLILKLPVGEKVKLVDETGISKKITAEAVRVKLADYDGLFTYKLDENNEIKEIDLALTGDDSNNENLKLLYNSQGETIHYQSHYSTSLTTFQNIFYLNNDVKVFVVPDDELSKGQDSNYKVSGKNEFSANSAYDVIGYNFDLTSNIADYVVCKKKIESDFKYHDSSLGQFVLVEDIYDGLNMNDEPCCIVKGKIFGYSKAMADIEYYAPIDGSSSAFDNATDMVKSVDSNGNPNTYKVKVGDIIRAVTEQDNKTVIKAQILYSSAMKSPEFPEGRNGWLVGTTSNLLNAVGYFTNPYGINYESGNANRDAGKWTGGCKILYGFVYNAEGDIVELTTKDLSVDSSYDNKSAEYSTEVRRLHPSYTYTITESNGQYILSKGSSQDLKSYKNAGDSCSKAIMVSLNMNDRLTIIIND